MQYEIGRTRSGLRLGYTTGSCAAAASKAAAEMLLGGREIRQVSLMTPKGIRLYLDIEKITAGKNYAECAVRKYSGDDPDITDGVLVFAKAEYKEGPGDVIIEGGNGVGRITKPGLDQEVGRPAINKVPRRMICEAVREVCEKYGYEGRIKITVSIPGGEEMAKKTFNPRLGIVNGLSVIGTTGIVEPMSEKALTDTIYLEMKTVHDSGHLRCFLTPGNYGIDYLKKRLCADQELCVKCSNYIGEAVDQAGCLGMKGVVLAGHIGKIVKVAAGVMNTHSRQADCRMEVFAAHAAMAGAGRDTVEKIMRCVNTSQATSLLKKEGILDQVLSTIMEKIRFYLRQRAAQQMEIEAVMFSPEDEIMAKTAGADELIRKIQEGEDGI